MLKSRTTAKGFDSDLKAILPRLRVYALALTHDRDRADDLVQQTAVKALVGRKSFRPGTNFGGWLFRIQRNEFISGLRRLRPTVCFDDISTNTLSHPPHQESGLVMREFMGAFRHLAPGTRQALLVKEGDKVLFTSWAGSEVKVDGQDYLIMSEDDLLAVIG